MVASPPPEEDMTCCCCCCCCKDGEWGVATVVGADPAVFDKSEPDGCLKPESSICVWGADTRWIYALIYD